MQQVGQQYITLIAEGTKNTWYLATCMRITDDNQCEMEFLHRVEQSSNLKWKNPSSPVLFRENVIFQKRET